MAGSVNAARFMPEFTIKVVKGTEKCIKSAGTVDGFDEDVPAFVSYIDGDNVCTLFLLDMFFGTECDDMRDEIIVHESVHCMQAWLKYMDERPVGEEEQAYMVQACYKAINKQL